MPFPPSSQALAPGSRRFSSHLKSLSQLPWGLLSDSDNQRTFVMKLKHLRMRSEIQPESPDFGVSVARGMHMNTMFSSEQWTCGYNLWRVACLSVPMLASLSPSQPWPSRSARPAVATSDSVRVRTWSAGSKSRVSPQPHQYIYSKTRLASFPFSHFATS